jgi:3-oxoacyl-[acyl-carrier protein] reductase
MRLAGQVAIVTGASRGIGAAAALALAREGAAVLVGYRDRTEEARAVVRAIQEAGGGALAWQADLTDPQAATRMVEEAVARWGRVDILVNNAGTALEKLLLDTTPEEWDSQMAVHLRGAYACSRSALRPMLEARRGRIINISSIWGITGAAGEVAYSTAKAGLIGFTKALAKEVGRFGITVNAVAPGLIRTEMLSGYTEAELAELTEQTPAGRVGTPEEVAAAVLYLASPEAAFLTGQVISPNGGLVI